MTVLLSEPASYDALREFHSDLYLNHLKTFKEVDDDYIVTDEDVEYGIGMYVFNYYCPQFCL